MPSPTGALARRAPGRRRARALARDGAGRANTCASAIRPSSTSSCAASRRRSLLRLSATARRATRSRPHRTRTRRARDRPALSGASCSSGATRSTGQAGSIRSLPVLRGLRLERPARTALRRPRTCRTSRSAITAATRRERASRHICWFVKQRRSVSIGCTAGNGSDFNVSSPAPTASSAARGSLLRTRWLRRARFVRRRSGHGGVRGIMAVGDLTQRSPRLRMRNVLRGAAAVVHLAGHAHRPMTRMRRAGDVRRGQCRGHGAAGPRRGCRTASGISCSRARSR